MEALIFAANILYLVSYLVRNMLHLRILTMIAACCLVGYFYNLEEPLMTVIAWNLFFVGMNAFQLGRIFGERHRKRVLSRARHTSSVAQVS
jgi:hypothetical protein